MFPVEEGVETGMEEEEVVTTIEEEGAEETDITIEVIIEETVEAVAVDTEVIGTDTVVEVTEEIEMEDAEREEIEITMIEGEEIMMIEEEPIMIMKIATGEDAMDHGNAMTTTTEEDAEETQENEICPWTGIGKLNLLSAKSIVEVVKFLKLKCEGKIYNISQSHTYELYVIMHYNTL